MQAPRYTVSKGKLGRYNFVLQTNNGRVSGSVAVGVRKDHPADVMRTVQSKIRALADDLSRAAGIETA